MPWFQEWWALTIPVALCIVVVAWAVADNRRLMSPKHAPAPSDSIPIAGRESLQNGRFCLPADAGPGGATGRGGSERPKPTAVIFLDRRAPSPSKDPALDLQHALNLADQVRFDVLRCYVAGPMRPRAFIEMINYVLHQRVSVVLTPRIEQVRLDDLSTLCNVMAVDTGIVYPRQIQPPRPVEAPRLWAGHA
ncbi:hypothetical protein AB4305_03165 [Nocardia sp. 2YAB30]|uniref:hypothetical protein n=1 Tax=Nocardia sp. 2YAB30 TaxID=3233022 RepID=UPI003F949B3D